jgi:hypothetical protein
VVFRQGARPQRQHPGGHRPGRVLGFALLTGRWRALQHITASPGKIGDIARAAPVLTISNTAASPEIR